MSGALRDAFDAEDAQSELAALLEETERVVRRYVVLTDAQTVVVVLWVAHTHAIAATSTTPYLHVTSAEQESGKSRLLEVLALLARSPLSAVSMTPAVLFRAVHERAPTVFFDEIDNTFGGRDDRGEILAILNAGYRRGTPALRMGGAQRDRLDSFDVFGAKALAGIGQLPPTLASRCLRVELRRRRQDELCSDFFHEEASTEVATLREALAEWADGARDTLRYARPARVGLRDRLEEGCRLLVAIAQAAGGDWETRTRESLIEVAADSNDGSETARLRLLRDIRDVFGEREELATAELLAGLFAVEEAPWAEWWADPRSEAGSPIPGRGGAMKLARQLKPLGVKPRDLWLGSSSCKGYRALDFEDAYGRYLTASAPDPPGEVARSRDTSVHAARAASEVARIAEPLATSKRLFPAPVNDSRDLATSEGGTRATSGDKAIRAIRAGTEGVSSLYRAAAIVEEMDAATIVTEGVSAADFGAALRQTAFRLSTITTRLVAPETA